MAPKGSVCKKPGQSWQADEEGEEQLADDQDESESQEPEEDKPSKKAEKASASSSQDDGLPEGLRLNKVRFTSMSDEHWEELLDSVSCAVRYGRSFEEWRGSSAVGWDSSEETSTTWATFVAQSAIRY